MAGLLVLCTLLVADKVNDMRKEKKRAKQERREMLEHENSSTSQRGREVTSNRNDGNAPSYTAGEAPPPYDALYGSRSSSEERRERETSQSTRANG